ncbi:poly(A) polymerase [Malonomonas rubra DSM 5091]|uniref:Poly(A) polymerase n=1 Tax=Malonomonas rubra DSM 5091 TaxID=1122189 RepID=A0A1M6LH15_MALRU|nr:CCA tRNA nucleotidyltransferase [Malonomonas rubra]SHJ70405.1 poly(A) polymerase [Malonomonas rubra DSM 5091]
MTNFNQRVDRLFVSHPDLEVLRQILAEEGISAWLVGGTLRDLLLQKEIVDIDIATVGDPSAAAQKWARKVAGRWFWLDEERSQSRVLTSSRLTVDFTPLRAPTIEGDLSLRDFRINAMALPLDGELNQPSLLDPLSGQDDLHSKCLRFCSERSLQDDPLRMLKGIRHAVTLPVKLDDASFTLIKEHAELLKNVAGERIRDELGKIFSSPDAVEGFTLLESSGLLQVLLGQSQPDYQRDLAVSALTSLQQSIEKIEAGIADNEGQTDPFNSRAIFFLATLLRFYRPEKLDELLHKTLRLSRQQERVIISLQQAPSVDWYRLAATLNDSRKKALLVEQLGYFPDEQLLYWAIYEQKISLDKVYNLLGSFYQEQKLGRVPDLLDGHQLRELLHDQPDSSIGEWQTRIKQAELDGQVNSAESASRWLQQQLSD